VYNAIDVNSINKCLVIIPVLLGIKNASLSSRNGCAWTSSKGYLFAIEQFNRE
jgi:hypothetical protein